MQFHAFSSAEASQRCVAEEGLDAGRRRMDRRAPVPPTAWPSEPRRRRGSGQPLAACRREPCERLLRLNFAALRRSSERTLRASSVATMLGEVACLDADQADIVGRFLMRQTEEGMLHAPPGDWLIGRDAAGRRRSSRQYSSSMRATAPGPRRKARTDQRQVHIEMRAADIDRRRSCRGGGQDRKGGSSRPRPWRCARRRYKSRSQRARAAWRAQASTRSNV